MFKTAVLKTKQQNMLYPIVTQQDKINNKYTIEKHLGIPSGQADLYLCTSSGEDYIVKLYKHGVIIDKSIMERITKIKSHRLVPILESGEYKGRYFEVHPYYSKGDLSRVEAVEVSVLREYIIPFLNEALHEIHLHNLAHMDLKPSNIFIDDADELHLGDFGICSVLSDASVKITTAKGTFGYRPPESYSEISIKSTQFDYYSLGMTLIHLWNGKSPYEGLSEMQILAYTLDGKILMPENMPEDLKLLIRGLTAYDKKKRIGYETVVRWCNGLDIRDQVDIGLNERKRYRIPGEYDFKGEVIKSVEDLSVIVTRSESHWLEGIKRLRHNLLDDFIAGLGDDALSVLVEAKSIVHDDYALSYLILNLTNNQIVWKTKHYVSADALGQAMQKQFPELCTEVKEMIQSGYTEALIDEASSYNPFEIGFMLSEASLFHYKGTPIHRFDELAKCMLKDGGDVLCEMDCLMKDRYFCAWLGQLKRRGYQDV